MDQLPAIDWDAAIAAGTMVLPAGPALDSDAVADVVARLRHAAAAAVEPVAEVTGIAEAAAAEIFVVDRASWLKACTQSAQQLLAGVAETPEPTDTSWRRARAKALGGQAGVVLAMIATRILGQFDPFYQPNRLLLVAPNVVTVERELHADPADFRLWICLHEQTHRAQFGRAPWLREHLLGLITELMDDGGLFLRLEDDDDQPGHRRVVGTQAQSAAFDQASAVMSLLEGHADVMMDRVGSAVVPSYRTIREGFDQRRSAAGWFAWIQKLLGMDIKYAQYRDGAAFCEKVLAVADRDTLSLAFSSADLLPSLAELREPQLWLKRV